MTTRPLLAFVSILFWTGLGTLATVRGATTILKTHHNTCWNFVKPSVRTESRARGASHFVLHLAHKTLNALPAWSATTQSSKMPRITSKLRRFWSGTSKADARQQQRLQQVPESCCAEVSEKVVLATQLGRAVPLVKTQTVDSYDDDATSVASSRYSDESSRGSMKITSQAESIRQPYYPSRSKSRVSFDQVTTHYHRLVLGDHPQVSNGVPVAFGGWESSHDQSLEEFEAIRERFSKEEDPWGCRCRLSAKVREAMLLEEGVTSQSIRQRLNIMKIQNNTALRSKLIATHQKSR